MFLNFDFNFKLLYEKYFDFKIILIQARLRLLTDFLIVATRLHCIALSYCCFWLFFLWSVITLFLLEQNG